MRYAFISQLTKLAEKNENIVLLTADLGFTVFEEFRDKLPNQFINVGVAESNMIGVAAGLALSGKIVFAYSIATFATMRTFEQIRNDVCLHNLPVTIVGSGAGLSYSDAGPSHHAVEDISIMRTLPNITVICPADPFEMMWATQQAVKRKRPMYLRIGKRGEPQIYKNKPDLSIGKGSFIKKGRDFAIIATGNIVHNAYEASLLLEKSGHKGSVISMHTIKPIDKNLIKNLAKKYDIIITVEEHILTGGLGGTVAETLATESSQAKLYTIGLPDAFVNIGGSQAYLRNKYDLSATKIASKILKLLKHE